MEVGAGSEHPCRACIIHHRADGLLIQQDYVPNGEITSPLQDGNQHTHTLGNFLSELIDVRRTGESYT